jgi:NAD-dependent dihydropyrimidine dehydrogenase PreA subunit
MNVNIIGNNCTGCYSCEQTCPLNAITLSANEEGFFYPVVSDCCIDCGACLAKCHLNTTTGMNHPLNGYAAYDKDESHLKKSSSGGVFAGIATEFIKSGGIVCGCAEDAPGYVHHIAIDSIQDIPLLQGSKYVESD